MERFPKETEKAARRLALACALAVPVGLLPPDAISQALDLESLVEIDDDRADVAYQDVPVAEIEDMVVIRGGDVIGEVEEILGDRAGAIVALVIEYGGDALGIGDREVAVPIDELQIDRSSKQIRTTLTDRELERFPAWDD